MDDSVSTESDALIFLLVSKAAVEAKPFYLLWRG
jgi:hypothetical protein